MEQFLKQVKHNENLYKVLCDNHAEEFYDWKITCLFYCAFHLIQALAAKRKVNIGNNHTEIFKNLSPKNHNRLLQIKADVFDAYDILFEYSRTARYDGFKNFSDFTFQEMKKNDLKDAVRRYEYIKKYVESFGVVLLS